MKGQLLLAGLGLLATAISAQPGAQQPLFATKAPLRIEIKGPITALVKGRREARTTFPATLTVIATGEHDPIGLTPRGITRLREDVCRFPPLRVDFTPPPVGPSPFAGQDRIKLVTHCRPAEDFQQKVLLEYAAYRMFNQVSPASFNVRLATIDYVEADGRPFATRVGYFLENDHALAARLGLVRAKIRQRVPLAMIDPASAARFVLFDYMIGNLDWALQDGPPGENCCHNGVLLTTRGYANTGLVAVPYDFDFSGLVDAPYATPPDGFSIGSVKQRVYRGYCVHNNAVLAAARDFRARRPTMLAELGAVPGIRPDTVKRATAYLDGFFALIASDDVVTARILLRCLTGG